MVYAGSAWAFPLTPFLPNNNVLMALNASTGQEIWSIKPSSFIRQDKAPMYPKMSQAVISGNTIYLTSQFLKTKSECFDVFYAINIKDGSEQRHYKVPGYSMCFPSSPVVDKNVIYFASSDSTIYALSLS
jgi:outer membrane protein assembly factor BamB